MANVESKLVISEPDFFAIKTSLKNFLRSQSTFADYDFEGSTLSQLIDLLAYNTHYLSFYMNMVANESFLDTAALRDSVVSHAKMLGYTPSSIRSARGVVDLTFTQAANPSISGLTSLTLPKFTKFASSSIDGVNYTFVNLDEVTVTKSANAFTFSDLSLYEGNPVSQVFVYNEQLNPLQEFKLIDKNIDTSTIRVLVRDTETSTVVRKFTLANSLIDVKSDSKVFFIQEIEDQRYELIFGDGIFGEKLENQNYIEVSYIVTNGPGGNGISAFSYAGRIVDNNDNVIVNGISILTALAATQGGNEIESVSSIKKYSTKSYSSQNRAIKFIDNILTICRIIIVARIRHSTYQLSLATEYIL